MFFSKSFGYAIRGILYISIKQAEGRKIQVHEIAEKLSVPKHFLGKIFQSLVKERLLKSTKGPFGGFELEKDTLSRYLFDVFEVTDDITLFNYCELRFHKCGEKNHCPLHHELKRIRTDFIDLLRQTTIGDLISGKTALTIDNLAAVTELSNP